MVACCPPPLEALELFFNPYTMALKETMKQAGYEHVLTCEGGRSHILRNLETGNSEVWFANKDHAGYGIIYKNTHLEFAHSLPY